MSDLHALLHEAAHAVPLPPATSALDADLARGRRALARRRRVRWTAVPAGLAAVAAAGLVIAGSPLAAQHRGEPPAATVAAAPSPSAPAPVTTPTPSAVIRVALVAYTGGQPAGYTVDKVPDGWQVQGVDRYSLVIAPVGTRDTDPDSFAGKILVSKANPDEVAVERDGVTPVTVGRVTAKLFTFDEPEPEPEPEPGARPAPDDELGTQGLLLPVGKGSYLIFQIPGTLGWDAATVADFAAGVHMTDHARAAAG